MFSPRFLTPAAFAALALCSSVSRAATFNINGTSDSTALINAINLANSNGEPDTINLSGYFNFSQADNSTYGPTGYPVIKNDGTLTINAAPSTFIGRINNDNNPKVRIFAVGPGAKIVINGLRFSNGAAGTGSGGAGNAAANRGGGIYNGNGGDVTLNDCEFDYNTAVSGAAIFNGAGATLKVSGGTFAPNTADENGGAIYAESPVSIADSLFSTNRAGSEGGAIYIKNAGANSSTGLQISNSTLAGNAAGALGGAMRNAGGFASLQNCTVTDNNTFNNSNGGALSNAAAPGTTTSLGSTLVAGNKGNDIEYASPGPNANNLTFRSTGYNLIGVGSAAASFNGPGDQVGITDPKLNQLSNNGGRSLTVALQPDSPAVNAGNPTLPGENQFDQRGEGFPRVRGQRIDIGAYEIQRGAPSVTVTLSPTAPKTNDVLTATAKATPASGSVTFAYRWVLNGTIIPGETKSTLQLSKAGNGDKNDEISVIVSASDSEGTSAPATARVTIVNSVPVAVSSQGTVDVDTDKAFPLLGFDADGDPLKFIRVGGPRNGTRADIVRGADGITRLTYRSRPKYGGVDIIRYVVQDNSNAISNESTLGVKVLYTPPPPVNRKPIAGNTNIDTFVNTSVIKGLLGTDPDGDPVTFRIVNNARYGKSEIKRDTDGLFKLFYTSLPKFYGPDRVTYIAVDPYGAESNIATVNINFTNRKPVANGNKLTVASGEAVSQFVFGTDEDGDVLSFRLVNNPQHGTGEIKRDEFGNWRVYYQSALGYVGPDQITFIAIDPMGRESFAAAADIDVVRVAGTPSEPSAISAGATPSGGGA